MKSGNNTQGVGTRLLMWISQLLLLLFLVQWLRSSYSDEKAALQKNLALQYQLMESSLTDSMAFRVVSSVHDGDGPKTKMQISFTDTDRTDRLTTTTVVTKDELVIDSVSPRKGRLGQLRTFERKIELGDRHEMPGQDIDSALSLIIAKGVKVFLSDSLNRHILRMDDSILQARFRQKLAAQGMPFALVWQPSAKQEGIAVFTPLFSDEKILTAHNYQAYILKKLLPEASFAVLLLTITAAAFWAMHRSFKQQQRLSAMKNDLVSNMAHELKTPVATVKVALEALDSFELINDPKTSRDYLKMAVGEVDRLEMLVNQALNTSLLEAGSITMHKEVIDLSALAEQTVNALQVKFVQRSATVSIVSEGNNFHVRADKLHLQGVLINLLDNTLKYAGEKPVVRLKVEERELYVNIYVYDNGPGIPEKYIDKVFDKFFRVPMGDVHTVKGYGLGLSYAKQAVESMGGYIAVRNNTDDGCTFTISLPKT